MNMKQLKDYCKNKNFNFILNHYEHNLINDICLKKRY